MLFISISIIISSQASLGLFHWCHKWSLYKNSIFMEFLARRMIMSLPCLKSLMIFCCTRIKSIISFVAYRDTYNLIFATCWLSFRHLNIQSSFPMSQDFCSCDSLTPCSQLLVPA